MVTPYLRHLENQGVQTTDELGYSWGADKSAAGSIEAPEHGIAVKNGVWVEAVAVLKRHLIPLGLTFNSAAAQVDNYKVAGGDEPQSDRLSSVEDAIEFMAYFGGLLRISNLAIEHVLAGDGYPGRLSDALMRQPGIRVTSAYGTKSELVPNAETHQAIEDIRIGRPDLASRLAEMVIEGMHHAGGDDIDLHAAIMLQGLSLMIP